MYKEEITLQLQSIFIQHFHIPLEQFEWETPLEVLQKDFKILSYSVYLEQLLLQAFGKEVPIIENISTAIHTPKDILHLIIDDL